MLRAASHFDSMNSAGSIIVLVAYPQAQSLGLRAVDVAQESFMERLTQDEKQVHQELFWPFVLDYRFTGPHPRLVLDHPWKRGDAFVDGVNDHPRDRFLGHFVWRRSRFRHDHIRLGQRLVRPIPGRPPRLSHRNLLPQFWDLGCFRGLPQDPPYFFMQQFLNFLPLPQGQGSFLPTFCLPSGSRGRVRRGAGGRGGLALGTSAAFLPVSFSRANSNRPRGSPSSSLTRFQWSAFSVFSAANHSSYSGNRSPMRVQVSSR